MNLNLIRIETSSLMDPLPIGNSTTFRRMKVCHLRPESIHSINEVVYVRDNKKYPIVEVVTFDKQLFPIDDPDGDMVDSIMEQIREIIA